MSKFKVGDRVAVYGNFKQRSDHGVMIYLRGALGTVTSTIFHDDDEGSEITVTVPERGTAVVHPKQCRKLKKKERRRVWINTSSLEATAIYEGGAYAETDFSRVKDPASCTEFVEVRGKK